MEKQKQNNNLIYKMQIILLVCAVSSFLFFQFDVDFYAYFGVSFSLFVLFTFCFCCLKNIKFYIFYSSCALINLSIFLLEKYLEGYWICYDVQDILYIIYALGLLISLFISCVKYARNKNEPNIKIDNYFSERKDDLSRLRDYIKTFSVVGLESFWGNGKTYLYKLLNQNYKDYYYISLCVMTVKTDTVETYIINELNAILEQNGILSSASTKLLSFLKTGNFYGLGNLLIKNNSYTQLFNQLCQDVEKLKKTILITFEDIDRIDDKGLIYKILALSELLTSQTDSIKILFQYDEVKLLEVLGVEKIYLEKYIPHNISLTPINFRRCIKVLLKEGKKSGKYASLELQDFNFLNFQTNLNFQLEQSFGLNKSFSMDIYFSIRKVQLFLDEIEKTANENIELKNIKQVLITFFFIKHFKYSDFEDLSKFSEDDFYSSSKLFAYQEKVYSIYELMEFFKNYNGDKSELFDSVFQNNSKNLNHLIYLHYFGYDFAQIKEEDYAGVDEKVVHILNEEIKNIKIKEHNNKIDRLIRNLSFNGKSEYTNLENAVLELEKILDKSTFNEQDESFKDFCNSAFNEEFEKGDNGTVFRFGMSNFIPLFQGFRIYAKAESYWKKLIDFYFKKEKVAAISAEVIQIFNYCDISKKSVFLYVIEKFNSLKITGNLNNTICYPRFLKQFIGAFSSLGYIDTHIIDFYSFDSSKLEQNIKNYFDLYRSFSDKLRSLKRDVPTQQIKDECDLLINFLKHNVRLILAENSLKEYTGGIETSISMKDGLEDVFKDLDERHLSKEELETFLAQKYKDGELMASQVERIYSKYFPPKKEQI